MIEQPAQRDLVATRVEVRQPLRDVVVQAELAGVAQLENRDGGELLGDGADLENGVHGHGDVPLHVVLAVALEEQSVVALDDGGDHADDAVLEYPGLSQGIEDLPVGPAGLCRQ